MPWHCEKVPFRSPGCKLQKDPLALDDKPSADVLVSLKTRGTDKSGGLRFSVVRSLTDKVSHDPFMYLSDNLNVWPPCQGFRPLLTVACFRLAASDVHGVRPSSV